MVNWFFKKKRADQLLQELVEALLQVLGEKLISVILFGSKASGEYLETSSDLNIMIVLEDVSAETLALMHLPLKPWHKAGLTAPVLLQESELSTYAHALPVEFLDMKDHHQVIYGSDPLDPLDIGRHNLRAQCLQELSVKQLKLRQVVVAEASHPQKLRTVLIDSFPSILTLYRAALRLEMDVPRGSKISAAMELARRAGINGDCLTRLANNHVRRGSDNIGEIARHYLDGIEHVLSYLDRK